MLTTSAPPRGNPQTATTDAAPRRAREPRPGPPLRVVNDRALQDLQRRARARRLFAVAVAAAALGVFGVVIAHVLLMQGQFELQQLQEHSARSQAEYDRLRLQVSELESPDRIVAAAHEKLGMVTPPNITYLAPSADATALPAVDQPAEDAPAGAATALPARWSSVKSQLADG